MDTAPPPRRDTAATAAAVTAPRAGRTDDLDSPGAAFAAPAWIRDLGRTAWLLVGLVLLLTGLVWFLGATATIGGPLVAATIVATVAMPLVDRLGRHVPRAAAAALVVLGLLGIAALVLVLVIGGITSQSGPIGENASAAASKAQHWLESVGVDEPGAAGASEAVKADIPAILSTLTKGVVGGIRGIASVAFALSLAMLSVFFVLEDGPSLRRWIDRHLGVPPPLAETITGNLVRSLRGYFRGVTIVAAFNAAVVGLGALLLGVPLAGTIAVVTFVAAYVPYIGAFIAGAFAVIVALGAEGTGIAILMLVIVLLANGLLQNVVQPFAMGSALGLHPLVVMVVTIASGCIFGTLGMILAAPLLSAAVRVAPELAAARAQPESSVPGASSASPTS